MSKFCEGCPLVGDAVGELDDIEVMGFVRNVGGTLFGTIYGQPQIAGVVRDEAGRASRPLDFNETVGVFNRISECTGVEIRERKRLFREPASYRHCPALGRMALSRGSDEFNYVADKMGLQNR